ncbi:PREDICTED: NAC domain-containing protein 78-like [Ipomoea nil]|uniref:NAC domain-containing protein 78-like n=1 Tax=Ipomoea nil TaxID=35883 RepID=UPI0009014081|nr:PREDICTED: NAC domain-containing protein 78-like [Ipomoea nil]
MALRSLHGFIFKPTDKELLQYLEAFVLGKPLKHTFDFFAVEHLYGGKEPSEIFGSDGPMTRYYFTELKRKCEHGSRFLRTVGDRGTWKGQDRGKPIKVGDEKKTVMGFKKSLRYEAKKSKSKGGADERRGEVWLMKEYSLSDDYLRDKNVVPKDVVLCRIKRVLRNTSRSRELSTQNFNENNTPLEIYNWPENDNVMVSLPPSETSNLAREDFNGVDAYGGVSAMGSGVDDANGGMSAMGNDLLLDELDELLRKTPPHDIVDDDNFWCDILAPENNERIDHPGPVPIGPFN